MICPFCLFGIFNEIFLVLHTNNECHYHSSLSVSRRSVSQLVKYLYNLSLLSLTLGTFVASIIWAFFKWTNS